MVANQLYELCEAVGPDCTRYVPCYTALIASCLYTYPYYF